LASEHADTVFYQLALSGTHLNVDDISLEMDDLAGALQAYNDAMAIARMVLLDTLDVLDDLRRCLKNLFPARDRRFEYDLAPHVGDRDRPPA
jgi:hypothetical protein